MKRKIDIKRVRVATGSWRKRFRWDLLILVTSFASMSALSFFSPFKGSQAFKISLEYFKEMVFILPAVMVLMGLFAVWVKRETVVKWLGEGSGLKGMFISVLLGTLPTGPLYVAFPLASMLLRKGARVANVLLFLCAWACIKLPMELVELQFLGWKFTLARLALTIILIIPACLAGEVVYGRGEQKADFEPPVLTPAAGDRATGDHRW